MNAGSVWGSTFGTVAMVYIIGVVVVCLPALVKSLRAFARGDSLRTLRDERLAAAEHDDGAYRFSADGRYRGPRGDWRMPEVTTAASPTLRREDGAPRRTHHLAVLKRDPTAAVFRRT